jgi:hypothetical protein
LTFLDHLIIFTFSFNESSGLAEEEVDPILVPDEPEVGGGIFRMLEKLEEVTDSLLQRYGTYYF